MSKYYIETSQGDIYFLDSTTTIKKKMTGKATDNVVESGATLSDHYYNNPDEFSFNGTISDVKSKLSNNISTGDWITNIERIKESGTPFTFHFGDNISPSSSCVFTSLVIGQSVQRGSHNNLNAYSIQADIKKIRLSSSIKIVIVRDNSLRDITEETSESTGTTKAVDEQSGPYEGIKEIGSLFNKKASVR